MLLCAWRLCVGAFVWHVAALHFSRNQEPDSISPDLLRSVECDRKTSTIQMCAHVHTCIHNPQRNIATGHTLFPRPAERKEVRAGGHTNGRSACHTHYMKVPFTSTTSEMKWLCNEICYSFYTFFFLIKPVFSLLWKIVTSVFWVQQHFFACGNSSKGQYLTTMKILGGVFVFWMSFIMDLRHYEILKLESTGL